MTMTPIDARAVLERHGEQRLLDLGGARDLLARTRSCAASPTSNGSPVSATRPVMPRPTRVGGSSVGAVPVRAVRSPRNAIGRGRRLRGGRRGSCGSRSAARSSSAIVQPDLRDVVEADSLPERLCSIFRCAIERTSSRRGRLLGRAARGRSRRRGRRGPCRASSRSSSPPPRRRRARAGSPRARARPRCRSRR